jgi:hypothetical protein
MRTALLIVLLHAAGFAMTWKPFPFCTETHQVDSLQNLVWIDEAMIPERAPYRGFAAFTYHPGTCFVARTVQKPPYMDTAFVMEAGLSADLRSQEIRWQFPGPMEEQPHGTVWYSAAGEQDSSYFHTLGREDGDDPVRVTRREVHRRTPEFLIISNSIRRGDGPWQTYARDTVVQSGDVTLIYTTDEEGSWVTRCSSEGPTYVCTPTPVGDVDFDLNKQVWHLTGNRPDSLRTYRPDGRLESTEHWTWSPRSGVSVRQSPPRVRPRSRPRAVSEWGRFNLLGRILPAK